LKPKLSKKQYGQLRAAAIEWRQTRWDFNDSSGFFYGLFLSETNTKTHIPTLKMWE
jgi:hypothetical protein